MSTVLPFETKRANTTQNPKHKRQVCRYWMESKCQKGDLCEFLHAFDHDKMPTCPQGSRCERQFVSFGSTPMEPCPFTHPIKDSRCSNQDAGFCSLGNRCPHEHVYQPGPPPEISLYFFEQTPRVVKSTFRKAPCSQFQANNWCPYFEMCNFQH